MENYWLKNVRLEKGYKYENGVISSTLTEICHIRMEDGKITNIVPFDTNINDDLIKYDANQMLMLPTFKEMHIHIDKTYYGGPWKAILPATSIFDKFDEEKELLPKLLPTAQFRAEKILETLLCFGSTHVRTHCNIDPVIGLSNLEATMQALENFSGELSHEIVAFPQHGLLRSNSVAQVRQALKQGATIVGGVDPGSVDDNIEKSLQTIMDIAVEANAGIDIHLHDRDTLGMLAMNRLADLTEEAKWHGKVTVSHAFGFAGESSEGSAELAERFAKLGISITSSVPIGNLIMPIPMLREKGVKVELGTDSLTDHWSPFGNGDNLEKAGRLAELYHHVDELSLSQSLGYITGGITPLDKEGNQVWPQVGDKASVVFVDASCSAEAVARRSKKRVVLFNGNIVSGSFKKTR
ncbi:amidohydrolase family protein [Psychrobacillus psychrodurans]|uniref:Amidohydrolase family protein n=1 Tax=Psychrobacillus psychrodurans TaxID=126157 RepID=A0A9X3L8N6_9BACI|nr:amidohydrolase family protein [Psychrobacillus psychrodurans]MCZ8533437.1 amidohydrolase family protein [Psychrobacillus psychrodurans]